MLRHVRDHGLPEAFSRQSQQRAHEAVGSEDTPYGPIVRDMELRSEDGGTLHVSIQAPAPMLHTMVRKCAQFRALMREMLS